MTRRVDPFCWAWARLGLVVFLFVVACASAFAVECTSQWELTGGSGSVGQVVDYGSATDVCAAEAARIEGLELGLSISGCVASATSMTYTVDLAPVGGGVENRIWSRLPLGCMVEEEEPAGFSWNNAAHVGQALLVTACAFAFFVGFGAGRHV